MKRRTAILTAAGVSLALIGGSSALAFGTGLFGAGTSPGSLPPVINAHSAAGSSAGQPAPEPGSTQPHREGTDHADDNESHESHQASVTTLPGRAEDN